MRVIIWTWLIDLLKVNNHCSSRYKQFTTTRAQVVYVLFGLDFGRSAQKIVTRTKVANVMH